MTQQNEKKSGPAGKIPKKQGSVQDRFVKATSEKDARDRKRLITFVLILLGAIAVVGVFWYFFSDYYEVYRYQSMLEEPLVSCNPDVMKKTLKQRKDALTRIIGFENPYREDVLRLAVEKGTDWEREKALDELVRMNATGIKEMCRSIWLDNKNILSFRERALSHFESFADASELEFFFDNIDQVGAFGPASVFIREKADTKKVVEIFREHSAAKDRLERFRAVRALLPVKDLPEVKNSEQVRETLARMTGDEYKLVKRHAVWILSEIGGPKYVPLFIELAGPEHSMTTRQYAIAGLGRNPDQRALDALFAALSDTEYKISENSDGSLRKRYILSVWSADSLIKAGERFENAGNLDALARIEKVASQNALNDALPDEVRMQSIAVLGAFPTTEAQDVLLELAENLPLGELRYAAVGRLGNPECDHSVLPLCRLLETSLGERALTQLRISIINSLGRIGNTLAVPYIVAAAMQEPAVRHEQEMVQAAHALHSITGLNTGLVNGLTSEEIEEKTKRVMDWYENRKRGNPGE